ncbi:MAG: cytochrome c [candidate division KSB1 bacterium]|nr:cytochrome c [candidate division KSB1 bacterium]MDQ7063947.1 cytochrome c [candidate division KSB1 bacterium]
MKSWFAIALSGLMLFACGQFQTDHGQKTTQTISMAQSDTLQSQQIQLPERLMSVLRKEMQLIEVGMGQLLSHLAQGKANEAATVAQNIHDSFILKRNLSPDELQQLVSRLPAAFVRMDRDFHDSAQKLATAVQHGDFVTAIQLYANMSRACVSCHALYAAERFPALAKS